MTTMSRCAAALLIAVAAAFAGASHVAAADKVRVNLAWLPQGSTGGILVAIAERRAPVDGLIVLHRERKTDRRAPWARTNGIDRLPMGGDQHLIGAEPKRGIVSPGREEPPAVSDARTN